MTTATRTELRVHVRWMIRRDLPEVVGIEERSFDQPWSDADFLECLRARNCIGMVAEHGDRVIGYMLYELEKDHINVINFVTDPEYRRRGVGRQMIEKLKSKLAGHRRTAVTLVVHEGGLEAQLFFQRQGFLAERVLAGHFDDTGEAGYEMAYRIAADERP